MNYLERYKDRKEYYETNKGNFLDMMMNYALYGSSVNDYFMYHFYELPSIKKKSYITCRKHRLIQQIANKNGDVTLFSDKGKFNKSFSKYIKRDWIDIDDASLNELKAFLCKHKTVFLKDKTGCEGKGVKRIDGDTIDPHTLQQQWKGYLLEEAVIPCKELAEFCPNSLNTLRVTVLQNQHTKKHEIISAVLRISTGEALDNLFQGALVADIDLEKGVLATNGMNRKGKEFDFHPITHKEIKGFYIPHWNEVISMVQDLNTIVPNVGYVGWDIGITDDRGVLVIEGNDCADHDVPQLAKRRGMWPEFRERLM